LSSEKTTPAAHSVAISRVPISGQSQKISEAKDRTAKQRNPFEGDPNFVLSLARGLKVIEAFEGHTEGLTVADAARRSGISRAAVRRLLLTLKMIGYAESDGRTFRLKARILNLGFSYLSSASLSAIAQPVLEHLTELLHESSSLSVLDGEQIVYIARSATKRVMSVGLSVGSKLPAYCTSMGRVLLSALPEQEFATFLDQVALKPLTSKTITDKVLFADIIRQIRADGYALTDEELEVGLRSIAVPITAINGRVVASMNVGVHAARVSCPELIHRVLPILHENAETLGRSIRG
jgi:IclR family transcriptional regulator, pca regulon regulatory protein